MPRSATREGEWYFQVNGDMGFVVCCVNHVYAQKGLGDKNLNTDKS